MSFLNTQTRRLWNKDYICILLAVVFAAFTHNAFTVVFPVYVLNIGGNNALTGLMMTGMMIAGIITRLVFGPLIDKLGRKKILVLGSICFAINTILYCFVTTIPGVFALRMLNGVSQGIFFPVPPTVVADVTPEDKLVDAMGFFGIASSIGASLGPVVGMKIFEEYSALVFFIVTSVFALISIGFTLLIKDTYKNRVNSITETDSIGSKNRKVPKISTIIEFSVIVPSLIMMFISLGNSSVMNFLAPFGLERNILNISLFFLVNNVVMIITRLFIGPLTRKFGKMKPVGIGIVLVVIATLMIAFTYNMVFVVIASILFGMGMAISTQILHVIILELVPENRRGVANSTYMLLGDIGMGVGATIWGVTSAYGGYTLTYILSALVIAIAAITHIIYLIPKYKKSNIKTI